MENNIWEAFGLSKEEYQKIKEILGREPNTVELGMFGVMWSEHCSYKNSKPVLKLFPTKGDRVIQGPGENAGIVDIGDGLAVAMKIESHNHPSAIEPYQGAATGVGGIVRDIFAMGARPIALLDSLRFGDLEDEKVKYLFSGVVAGIAGYGNCIGIPTVGGEVYFNSSYNGNPLVNAMCIGLIEHGKIRKGRAEGVGNPVMVVGASTGRDGIGGASFASEELSEKSEEKRPAVQVGDPFMEKLLLEACMEIFETDYVVGIQDLGAAGLTSALSETASRADSGIEIDVSLVPRREEGMTPYEVMLSESQERMLLIVKKGKEEEVKKIFRKWGLSASVIGFVTDDGMLRVKDNGKIVAEIPAKALAENAPVYYREYRKPQYMDELSFLDLNEIPVPEDMNKVLLKLFSSPNLCSRKWIYRQYDYMVRTDTIVVPGGDASVLRVKGTKKGIAVTTDCNSRYCYLNPFVGGQIAVAEAARNIVATGAKPLAITDGLNFGNPEKPEIFWQFREAVLGISDACEKLGIPVVSGNVSFYNETEGKAIYPTPIIGMVGLIEDIDRVVTHYFKDEGDIVVLIGENKEELGASEYLSVIYGLEKGKVPGIDLNNEKVIQEFLLKCVEGNLIKSCHDVSDGGLAIALAECSFAKNLGIEIDINSDIRQDAILFGESQSRFIITIEPEKLNLLEKLIKTNKIPYSILGKVKGTDIIIRINGVTKINLAVNQIKKIWEGTLECFVG